MSVARTADLLAEATRASHAVAAFNVVTLEHAEAICQGAADSGHPVILQLSHNSIRFHDGFGPLASACSSLARGTGVPVALHLDHLETLEILPEAAGLGFSSVMVDTSGRSDESALAATREAVSQAHRHGLWAEAELGHVGGKPGDPHAAGARTDPDLASPFVEATRVDGLAVAVGSTHGVTDRSSVLDVELVARLRGTLRVPLVLHGSSGVPDGDLRKAVEAGIVKVNIGTALNVAYTTALRRHLEADADVVDPRRALQAAREAMVAVVADRIDILSSTTATTSDPATAQPWLHGSRASLPGSAEHPNTGARS
jgi:fructose-bisphosphate aldolase class II